VRFCVVFRTEALFSASYRPYETELSDKVIRHRDISRLPFWQIAASLAEQGYRGARGAAHLENPKYLVSMRICSGST